MIDGKAFSEAYEVSESDSDLCVVTCASVSLVRALTLRESFR